MESPKKHSEEIQSPERAWYEGDKLIIQLDNEQRLTFEKREVKKTDLEGTAWLIEQSMQIWNTAQAIMEQWEDQIGYHGYVATRALLLASIITFCAPWRRQKTEDSRDKTKEVEHRLMSNPETHRQMDTMFRLRDNLGAHRDGRSPIITEWYNEDYGPIPVPSYGDIEFKISDDEAKQFVEITFQAALTCCKVATGRNQDEELDRDTLEETWRELTLELTDREKYWKEIKNSDGMKRLLIRKINEGSKS